MKRNSLLLALAFIVLAAPVASAQSNLGLKRIGPAFGFVSPENVDATVTFGAFADLGTIAPRIGLESHLDYWTHSENSFGVDAHIHDVTLGARGKYFFETSNPKIRPFAGAGLALHFIGAEVAIPAVGGAPATSVSDSQTKLGLDLGGGIATPINPRADFLGEAWYGVVSDISQLSLRAGVSFKVGR